MLKKLKLNVHSARRILIAVFCICIATCVTFVMFQMYNPSQNALNALSSVCMDVICIIILLIVISSFAYAEYVTNRTTKLFVLLLLATMWGIFLDYLNWVFDGSLEFGHLTFWFTLGSFCMGAILACIFSIYLHSYMVEIHNLSQMRISAYICAILNMISFCISFILGITGTAFQFVDGHYEIGALYDVVTVIPILTLLYLTGVAIRYVKIIGVHDVFAVVGYISFMIAGVLIEAVYTIGTTYVAVAIADIFIFVTLQNEIIAQEKRKVQVWMQRSNTDELTGFYNRHAYEDDVLALEEGTVEENFVYVSVDVNSLKVINDSLGHNAGDELLVGAAECLRKCFGAYGKLYRIGGDEFIALLSVDEKQLMILQSQINEITAKWSGKLVRGINLSCGYVTRKEAGEMTVRQMAILADRRMYEAKENYYRCLNDDRAQK